MIPSKIGFAYKNSWGITPFKARDRMVARTLHILFHFLAGIAVAAYLLPEGTAIVLGSLALVVASKALYDFIDAGAVKFDYAAALAAGGLISMLTARFL